MRFAWVDDNCKPPQGVRVRDLIAALGEANRLAGVENESARYWQQRLKILSELFDLPPDWVEDTAHTPRMIADLAQACQRVPSAPPVKRGERASPKAWYSKRMASALCVLSASETSRDCGGLVGSFAITFSISNKFYQNCLSDALILTSNRPN